MKHLLMSTTETETLETEDSNPIDESEDDDNVSNGWYQWAKSINEKVQEQIIDNEGDRDNARYLPAFVDKLITDARYLPL